MELQRDIELLPREAEYVLPSRIPPKAKENESGLEDADALELDPSQIFHELKDLSSEWWELARAMSISFNKRTEWADRIQMTNDQRLETAINEWCEIKGFVTQHDLTKILRKSGRGQVHIPLKEREVFNIFKSKADRWEEIQEKMGVQVNNEEMYHDENEEKSDLALLRIVIRKWFVMQQVDEVKRDEVIQILEELGYRDLIKEHKPLTVEEVFDKISKFQLKPSEWWEIGGDLSIDKDDRNELKNNQSLKDDGRLERVIWLASQQSLLTEKKLDNVSKLLRSKQERLKYEKQLLLEHLAIGVVTTLVVITIIMAGCITLIVITHEKRNTFSRKPFINTNNAFILDMQEFDNNLESINLTLFTGVSNSDPFFNDDDKTVHVYKIECDLVMEMNLTLSKTPYELTPKYFEFHKFNHFKSPIIIPLYGLSGRVDFDISAEDLNNSSDPKCSIYIFNDYNSYSKTVENDEAPAANITRSPPCLPTDPDESSPTIFHWSYEFNTEQFIYISLELNANIDFKANISGYVIVYRSPAVSSAVCNLTKDMNSCSINICNGICSITRSSIKPKQCIVVKLSGQPREQNNVQIHYTTHLPRYTLSFLLILIFLVLVPFIILITAILVNFGIYQFRKMSNIKII